MLYNTLKPAFSPFHTTIMLHAEYDAYKLKDFFTFCAETLFAYVHLGQVALVVKNKVCVCTIHD